MLASRNPLHFTLQMLVPKGSRVATHDRRGSMLLMGLGHIRQSERGRRKGEERGRVHEPHIYPAPHLRGLGVPAQVEVQCSAVPLTGHQCQSSLDGEAGDVPKTCCPNLRFLAGRGLAATKIQIRLRASYSVVARVFRRPVNCCGSGVYRHAWERLTPPRLPYRTPWSAVARGEIIAHDSGRCDRHL